MFMTTLLVIVKTWKQPKCPSPDEWLIKLWYTQTTEYYSETEKKQTIDTHDDMGDSQNLYAEPESPDSKVNT